MKNPFKIGIVNNDEDFCNRVKECKELLQYARSGSNVVLCSPRRYGKSSLVTMVLASLQKEGFLTAYIDLFPVSSERDFITRFATAVFKGIGRGADPKSFIEKLKDIFKSIRPTIEVGSDGYTISAKYDISGETGLLLDDLLEGLHNYVKRKKISACIVFDEFQEITELAQAKRIEGTLRSHIQFQKEIAYFYVGSKRRILQDMFNDKSRPFYKSAFFYPLKEISSEDFIPYIEQHFRKTGKSCSKNNACDLYQKVRGYPYYVQKLASIAWDLTEKECNHEIIIEAFNSLREAETIDFEGIWSSLSMTQKSVLKAIAREPISMPYARDYLEKNQLSVGGTQKAIKNLIAKDLIEKNNNNYRLTDPIMEAGLKL
jgi:predicted transcriptional regulator